MRASILVADDEPGIRELLSWELGCRGHEVVLARDGAEALEQVHRAQFDLLLSDIRMPRVGGLEVLRATKQAKPDMEVVITTGYAELDCAIECLRHGAFDFIRKPFQTDDLLATVSRAIDHRSACRDRERVDRGANPESLASFGRLAAGFAHEIKNPTLCVLANHSYLTGQLSTLDRLATILESSGDGSDARNQWAGLGGTTFLADFKQALVDLGLGAERIRDIAQDMTSLGCDDGNPIVIDLNDPLRAALRMTSAETRRWASVSTDLGGGVEVLGSPARLSQLFVNLLINAAQAISGARDGRPHRIAIQTERRGNEIIAAVIDDGPGIPPEHIPRIFRTKFTTKPRSLGSGLGLVICREIAESHGGDLSVESTPGHGATFVLRLPARAPTTPLRSR